MMVMTMMTMIAAMTPTMVEIVALTTAITEMMKTVV